MTESPNTPSPKKPYKRRESRYQRIQERRAAKKAADNRFYMGMFAMMGLLAMFTILVGALMINGAPQMGEGMLAWTTPWIFGWTKLEVAGVTFVALIAISVWLRMRKPR